MPLSEKNTLARSKLISLLSLTRLDKPVGILLLLWPVLLALSLAELTFPSIRNLSIFVLGTIITRTAGCVINDLADQDIDLHVARTRQRPLANKSISSIEAYIVFVFLMLLSLSLFYVLNMQAKIQACIAASLMIFYPFTKRFFVAPQLVLGLAFAWSIFVVFAQLNNQVFNINSIILFITIVSWVIAYDTIYALADLKDDLLLNINTTAKLFGNYSVMIIYILQLLSMLGFIGIGLFNSFSNYYIYSIVIGTGLILIIQYQLIMVEKFIPAFKLNNIMGLIWTVIVYLQFTN